MIATTTKKTRKTCHRPARNRHVSLPPRDPVQAAKAAGLRYVHDGMPGIRRVKTGRGFRFVAPDGAAVKEPTEVRRIRSLVIPPAWTEVWICPSPSGHLQATGRDAKGRKQHRYHPRWREVRDETKYGRMMAFGQALPHIRARVEKDLLLIGMPRAKVLATVVRLLETTLIRIGNEEYTRQNGSYGLTTMRNHHADVAGKKLRFEFRGKSGVRHEIEVRDHLLARIVKRCQELPGQELFCYLDDDDQPRAVDSADVNGYLREISGQDFTAKDFRTWAGTVLTAWALHDLDEFDSEGQARKNVARAIEAVAKRLGNTPTVCRKCYVHPAIVDAYLAKKLNEALDQATAKPNTSGGAELPSEEAAVLDLLQRQLTGSRG